MLLLMASVSLFGGLKRRLEKLLSQRVSKEEVEKTKGREFHDGGSSLIGSLIIECHRAKEEG